MSCIILMYDQIKTKIQNFWCGETLGSGNHNPTKKRGIERLMVEFKATGVRKFPS